MNDEKIKRCSVCGGWTYMSDQDILKLLLGEQLICQQCIKRKDKKDVA